MSLMIQLVVAHTHVSKHTDYINAKSVYDSPFWAEY